MRIDIKTDNHVQFDPSVEQHVNQSLESVRTRYGDQITWVEVHVGDVNAGKKGDLDKRCMMEARVDGRPPLVAEEHAATLASAISGAARKLLRVIESDLGKLAAARDAQP